MAGSTSSRRTRKIAAIAAGALVVGVGATYTLASWNDSEWVWGGADGGPGVGTSSFNVQQDVSEAFSNSAWNDEPDNPGGALVFSPGALSLVPGDTIYAPVALRTAASSDGATVTLQAATPALQAGTTTEIPTVDPDDDLWRNIEVAVYTANIDAAPFDRPATCDAAGVSGADWTAVAGVSTLDSAATATQTLAAQAGDVQHYCFALTLNDGSPAAGSVVIDVNELQGRTIAPAWQFAAESN